MSSHGRLNIIIVNYNSHKLTINCINSILNHKISSPEDIIVVDNLSPDDSVIELKRFFKSTNLPVKLYQSPVNNGYSSGVNAGVELADKEFILVLNPDTYFNDNKLNLILDRFDTDNKLGIAGLDLCYPDGERQYAARRFYTIADIVARRSGPLQKIWPFSKIIKRHLMISEWLINKPFEADWVMGTGFIIRKSTFDLIGRMNEKYFLYMEDVDLCARVWKLGLKVLCFPSVTLVHDHQRSSAKVIFSNAAKRHFKSLFIFWRDYKIPFIVPPSRYSLSRSFKKISKIKI